MTTMMTMTTTTMTTGIATEMPNRVRDELKALLENDEAGVAPIKGRHVPLVGIGISLGRGRDGGPMGGGGSTRVILDAPMMMACLHGLTPTGHSCHCRCAPWTSFTIRGRSWGGMRWRTTTTATI
jgi:hypothetical protein